MKRRKMVSLLLTAAITAGMLTGCGGNSETTGTAGKSDTGKTETSASKESGQAD